MIINLSINWKTIHVVEKAQHVSMMKAASFIPLQSDAQRISLIYVYALSIKHKCNLQKQMVREESLRTFTNDEIVLKHGFFFNFFNVPITVRYEKSYLSMNWKVLSISHEASLFIDFDSFV